MITDSVGRSRLAGHLRENLELSSGLTVSTGSPTNACSHWCVWLACKYIQRKKKKKKKKRKKERGGVGKKRKKGEEAKN